MAEAAPILVSVEAGIARLTFNRPHRKNALDAASRSEAADHLERLAEDPEVRVIVLRGAEGTFCAGGDIEQFTEEGLASSRRRMRRGGHRMALAIAAAEKPVIAAVEGHAIGMGWAIALACDLIVASDTARFRMPYVRLGMVPDVGAAFFLTRALGPHRARNILYSGREVTAAEAQALGIVSRLCPAADFEDVLEIEARMLAEAPTFAIGRMKQLVDASLDPPLSAFLEFERLTSPQMRFTEDFREGTAAFREKRPPKFTGR